MVDINILEHSQGCCNHLFEDAAGVKRPRVMTYYYISTCIL